MAFVSDLDPFVCLLSCGILTLGFRISFFFISLFVVLIVSSLDKKKGA
jgi:hypothetical protein